MRRAGLLRWLDQPRGDVGVYWLEDGSWEFHPYAVLADRVRGVSEQLRARGVVAGDVVGVADPGCVEFLCGFFGAVHAGAAALPVPAPEAFGSDYVEHVGRIASAASAKLLIAGEVFDGDLLAAAARAGGAAAVSIADVRSVSPRPPVDGALALIQFTSGSTGSPRGVEITRANLEANIAQINEWLDARPSDSAASWLPWHHDMGLVGMLLASSCRQTTLWQMRPRDFLRTPVRWLECFGRDGATLAAAPNFAYGYVARRVKPARLEGLDFSRWRSAVVGAERLDPGVLASFADLLAPQGFRPEMIRPAYGLAEATLAVTGQRPGSVARTVRLRSTRVRNGEQVEIDAQGPLCDGTHGAPGTLLVTSGEPLPGVDIAVVADDGSSLPERAVGEIGVRGPTVASGYRGLDEGSNTRFDEGWLRTGDAGFLHDGELYVFGRMGDSIKSRGRTVYAESVEIAISDALDIPMGQCVVISSRHTDSDAIVAIVEAPPGDWADEAARTMRSKVGPSVETLIYGAPPGTIPRTTSGKPRRRRLWERITTGELTAELRLLFPRATSSSCQPSGSRRRH